jgi:hypothetical protein
MYRIDQSKFYYSLKVIFRKQLMIFKQLKLILEQIHNSTVSHLKRAWPTGPQKALQMEIELYFNITFLREPASQDSQSKLEIHRVLLTHEALRTHTQTLNHQPWLINIKNLMTLTSISLETPKELNNSLKPIWRKRKLINF